MAIQPNPNHEKKIIDTLTHIHAKEASLLQKERQVLFLQSEIAELKLSISDWRKQFNEMLEQASTQK